MRERIAITLTVLLVAAVFAAVGYAINEFFWW